MPAAQPQPILAPLTPAAIFLVATIDEAGEETVHNALPDLSGLVRAIGFRDPAKRLSLVTSIGSDGWHRLFAGPRPAELHPFVELKGSRHCAPATPGDLLFHIRAEVMDVCFELAGRIVKAMAGAATVVDEVHGFRFFDNRDLMGWTSPGRPCPHSWTEPRTRTGWSRSARPRSATRIPISPARATSTCRSTCTTCRRGRRCRSEQERVIGRTKLDDVEVDDDEKPADSHLALNVIEDDDGNELKIVRHNMPFGEVGKGEFGTCSSATRPATPIASLTSPPHSPAGCSSLPPSISSTIRHPCRTRRGSLRLRRSPRSATRARS